MPTPDDLFAAWNTAATPPPDLTVSEWAEQYRVLPDSSGARGGRWRNETAPYLRGIMDAARDPLIRKIALRKCHQSGGSESLHNILGYFIHYDPCPILFVHPTVADAQEWSKERLADMIRSTPALRAVVRDKRRAKRGEDESTLSLKLFPGGFLALDGANSPNTFARRAVRLAIGDDVDRFPAVVGDEGDPADLLVNRTTTFYDALTIFVSTPTLKGGRIDTLYQRSDQRRYVVTCPACGRQDWIAWSDATHFRVAFDERDPQTARLECPCGARMDEPARRRMVSAGEWQSTAQPKESGLAGFHLPAMVSTLGDVTLPRLVEKWLSARALGKESLRVFINTSLAEGWEDRTARMEPQGLLARREDYGQTPAGDAVEVPSSAVALTCGVDTQDDRFDLQVIAWGQAGERWVVEWRSIPGNPKMADTRAALLEALSRRYQHASGLQLPIHATCIDSAGHCTTEVYDFVAAYQVRRIYAVVGRSGRSGEPIVSKPSEKRYGRAPRPVRLYIVNTDDAKSEIMSGLSLAAPGPGYIHFPATVDEEYFAQLCAEHRETKYNRAGVATHSVWEQDRDRNEALDTFVYAIAAFRLLNPNLRQMAEMIAAAATKDKPAPPASAAQQSGAPDMGRRVTRSAYLQR